MSLIIREAVSEDAEALADIYNYYVENTHITFDLEPVDIANRLDWMWCGGMSWDWFTW